MKKIVLIILILLICSCEKKEDNIAEDVKEPEPIVEKYINDNPITIGLYNNVTYELLNSLTTDFIVKKDIGVFLSAYTNEDVLQGYYYQDVFEHYYTNYTEIDNYKIGYYISFTLNTGKVVENLILSPKDTTYFYPYLNTFLYDDVHQEKGAWYRHIEEDEINENSIFTSIKLQAEVAIDEVVTPITLTTFTYNSEDDFIDNKYRGNSSYTILIKKNN